MGIKNITNVGITTQTTPTSITRAGSQSGLFPVTYMATADTLLQDIATVQPVFNPTRDVWTLEAATTYKFEGTYNINTSSGASHTTAMAFGLGGGASVISCEYTVILWSAPGITIATTQSTTHVSGVALKVLNAASTANFTTINFSGIMRMDAGGTVTPQIAFSVITGAPVIEVRDPTYIKFIPLGNNTFTSIGSVS